ncbi:MAG: CPBP family intramembrane glutamic endopeptidase, partial [bacterium]
GLLVFVVFSHMRPLLSGVADVISRIVLAAAFLIAALLLRFSQRFHDYGSVAYAFFIAVVATSIDLYLPSREWWLALLHVSIDTPAGIAIDKLDSSVIIILTIVLLTKLAGGSLGSLFLQKRNWKKGLSIGVIAFTIAAVGSYFMAQLFGAVNLSLARIVPWIPWIMIFILGNACNEELLFRGLFLNKLKPSLGPVWANLVLILPFVLHHTGVTYTNDTLMFLAYLIPLAFFWGRIMQKTDSLLGSVLFHAGTDISVILVIFSQM